jgi:hypothetical protein
LRRPQTRTSRSRSSIDSATNTMSMTLRSSLMDPTRYTTDALVMGSISDGKSTEIGTVSNVYSEK